MSCCHQRACTSRSLPITACSLMLPLRKVFKSQALKLDENNVFDFDSKLIQWQPKSMQLLLQPKSTLQSLQDEPTTLSWITPPPKVSSSAERPFRLWIPSVISNQEDSSCSFRKFATEPSSRTGTTLSGSQSHLQPSSLVRQLPPTVS